MRTINNPTIDFLLQDTNDTSCFELMLRGPKGVLQSLHEQAPTPMISQVLVLKFQVQNRIIKAPVLLRPPLSLKKGDVVELELEIVNDCVTFTRVRLREPGKQANFLWAPMQCILQLPCVA